MRCGRPFILQEIFGFTQRARGHLAIDTAVTRSIVAGVLYSEDETVMIEIITRQREARF